MKSKRNRSILVVVLIVCGIGLLIYKLIDNLPNLDSNKIEEISIVALPSPPTKKILTAQEDIDEFVGFFNQIKCTPALPTNAKGWQFNIEIMGSNTHRIVFIEGKVQFDGFWYTIENNQVDQLYKLYEKFNDPEELVDSDLTQGKLSGLTDNLKQDPIKDGPPIDQQGSVVSFVDESGYTLESRIQVPENFQRVAGPVGSFVKYMRDLPLKPDRSPVLLFNGNEKSNDTAHVAVFDFDIGTTDLQQCADSVIKVYAEYFWSVGAYEQIQFHLTNGFLMKYTDWRDGNRLEVNGNNVQWVHTKAFDDSYECFRDYLVQVYIYAGTLSLSEESQMISLEELQVGDLVIQGGSPGHCVLVIDLATDSDGDKCFLLAQGYMPAQDFHVLTNPLHPEDPWYYESEITYPLQTPQYTFDEGSLRLWNGF